MERAHCKQNYDHKGDGCQNDGKSGLPGIVFSAVIRRRRVLPLGGLLRGLPLSVLLPGVLPLGGLLLDGLRLGFLLLGLLDGLLRLLLFCSAIGAEFHGFRDFFAAVVTIHVPLSFIFKIYDNYNFDRAISENLRCMPFFVLARARRSFHRIPQSATTRGRIFYNGSWVRLGCFWGVVFTLLPRQACRWLCHISVYNN